MRVLIRQSTAAVLLLGSVTVLAASTTEPVSGLPLAPGLTKTGDPIRSYTFCGKNARRVIYLAVDSQDIEREFSWYSERMPHAVVFTAASGFKTLITPDGTAAVELRGDFIPFLHFSPGLSPTEMKILGADPTAVTCKAD
ncbi:MAG TPA: hypothetical protein VMT17_18360 [Anaeromyxobacteraceae bacterium]|nr:hypothetical protein [Anaeromyxobacteraceae bacterium]